MRLCAVPILDYTGVDMGKRDSFKYIRNGLLVLAALLFAAIAGLNMNDVVKAEGTEELPKAVQCSFIVPQEFIPGSEPGLFVNQNYPMESSSIKYSIYDNGKDKVLTNREKQALLESGEPSIVDESANLTKEIYQKTMESAFRTEFGQDMGYTVTDFDKKIFDGFPGYRIKAEFMASGEAKVYQTAYIILSRYRTFTITYQRAEDDDCQESFEKSAETIRVR